MRTRLSARGGGSSNKDPNNNPSVNEVEVIENPDDNESGGSSRIGQKRCQSNEDPVLPEPTSKRSKLVEEDDEEMMEHLKCPICLDYPRRSPLYSCENGHIICDECSNRSVADSCAVCRSDSPKIRNVFAERFLEQKLKTREFQCRNQASGCSFKALMKFLTKHENSCEFKPICCPGVHRGACHWSGPYSKLIQHIMEKKCVQVVKLNFETNTYGSAIGDFPAPNDTVYTRHTSTTHWKPTMLINNERKKFYPYMMIYRTNLGEWFFYGRSFADGDELSNYRIRITVRVPCNTESDEILKLQSGKKHNSHYSGLQHVFEGDLLPHSAKEGDVMRSGMYLRLNDNQMRKLTIGKTLFEYSVNIIKKS